MASQQHSWQEIAANKQKSILDAIPEAYRVRPDLLQGHNFIDLPSRSGILTKKELQITGLRAVDILSRIRNRTYTSVEVTIAFCKRAAIAHQVTNCLAAVLFQDALETAEQLDRYMEIHGQPIGPLHGLPISVKEHIYVAGTPATSGLISWAESSSPEDALIIKIFRQAGAVFHVKTTNPQTLMALETHSNLFGRTLNPFNTALTSGGSSGGESALIAMRGSPLGIGTDIGGSIRGPAGFCGGYGLKPSVARIPHSGLSGLHGGMENIVGCVGPMANSIEDMKLFCQVALSYAPWDFEPSLIEIPWRPYTPKDITKKLTIGVLWHDGVVTPHPPVQRALRMTVQALRNAGHIVVDWDPRHHSSLVRWINRAYFLDGADEYREVLKHEADPPVPIVQWLLDSEGGKRHTVEETWKVNSERDHLRTAYAMQWRAAGVDAILSPVNASVASAHDESKYWGYTAAFNALDLPGTVFPITKVLESDTWDNPGEKALNSKDEEYRAFWDEKGAEKYRDAPVCLQLVGKRLQEEKLLAVTEVVDGLVREGKRTLAQLPRHLIEKEVEGERVMLQSRL